MEPIREGRHISEETARQKCDDLHLIYVKIFQKNNKTKVVFRCPKHLDKGDIEASWYHFKNSVYGCPYCSGRYKTTDDYINKVATIHPEIEILGKYVSMHTPIMAKCTICGHIWEPEARSLKTSEGCPVCGALKKASSKRKSHEAFVAEMGEIAPHIQILGTYKGTHKPIKCLCIVHGCVWESYPCNLLNESAGCPECATERFNNQPSKGERAIAQWLDDHKIPYHQEFGMDGLVYKRALRFDFYLPSYNIAIEFDGEQHYRAIPYWNDEDSGSLSSIQARDQVKNQYCSEHDIQLIRIPYTDFDKIDGILFTNILERNISLS